MDIYVRKSSRIHPILEKKITCLDIASVNVFEPGNGIFTKWLADTVDEASSRGVDAIYIENVLTERFANFFRKNGWIEKTNKTTSDLPSFFIVLKNRKTCNLQIY
jgi:hypothetical protein